MALAFNRDHLLFLLFGILLGFVAGYLAQDRMATVQPARVAPGVAGDVASAPAAAADVAPAGAPGVPGAPMAEINRLREALEKNPKDVEALLRLANLNFDIQRWDRARDLYLRFLELAPANPDALTDLGVCERNLSEPKKALERFRQAEQLDPKHWQSRFNEVVVLAFDLGDLPGADRALAALKELQPSNPDIDRLAAEVKKRKEGA